MSKNFKKYRFVVMLTLLVICIPISFGDSVYPSKIELIDIPKKVNVGEKILINYKITPESAKEAVVYISTDKSGGADIIREGNLCYFVPKRDDYYKIMIKTDNGTKDEVEIKAKTMLRGVDINIRNLKKEYGQYIKYLGMDVESSCSLKPVDGASSGQVILTSVVWQKGTLKSKATDGQAFTGYSEENGREYVEVTTDDNGFVKRVYLKNEPMTKSIELDREAIIRVGSAYKPYVTFTPYEALLYGYKDVIDKGLKITIEKSYVSRAYLVDEKKYEEGVLEDLDRRYKAEDDSTKSLELLRSIAKHRDRRNTMQYFMDNGNGFYCPVNNDDGRVLTDRQGFVVKVATIEADKVVAHLPGSVNLLIQPKDHIQLIKYMNVVVKDNLDDEIITEKDGKRISLADRKAFLKALIFDEDSEVLEVDGEIIDNEIPGGSTDLKHEFSKEEREVLNMKLIDFYKGKRGRPSPWAKVKIYEAAKYGLLTDSVQRGYGSNISEKEFAELMDQLYLKLKISRAGSNVSLSSKAVKKEAVYVGLGKIVDLSGQTVKVREIILIPYSVRETLTKEQAVSVVLDTYIVLKDK